MIIFLGQLIDIPKHKLSKVVHKILMVYLLENNSSVYEDNVINFQISKLKSLEMYMTVFG